MENAPSSKPPAVPPGGTKLNSTHIFFQVVAIALAIGAACWSAYCALDLASRPGLEAETAFEVIGSFLSLPFSLIALAVGLMLRKGIPRLRWVSIVTSVVAVCLPFVSIFIYQGKVAERERHYAKLRADIQAERLRNIPGGLWQSQRRLTDQQIAILVQDLSQLKGHKLKISCLPDDREGATFATDFIRVFKQAGWVGIDGGEIQLGHDEGNFIGLHLAISPLDPANGAPPSDAQAVVNALIHAGVQEPRYIYRYGGVPSGWMELHIGRNRPQPRTD